MLTRPTEAACCCRVNSRYASAGLELADSITIDPHKWFYAPLDAGAVLVKDEKRLTASFGMKPAYLTDEMEHANDRYQYYVHGFEQSRRFRSLKVWMSFKRYGARQIGEWIDNNVRQARHLYALVKMIRSLKRLAVPPMSAICIRYRAVATESSGAIARGGRGAGGEERQSSGLGQQS